MHNIGCRATYMPRYLPTQNSPNIYKVSAQISRVDTSIWTAGILQFRKGLVSKPLVPFNLVCGPARLGVPWRDVDTVACCENEDDKPNQQISSSPAGRVWDILSNRKPSLSNPTVTARRQVDAAQLGGPLDKTSTEYNVISIKMDIDRHPSHRCCNPCSSRPVVMHSLP